MTQFTAGAILAPYRSSPQEATMLPKETSSSVSDKISSQASPARYAPDSQLRVAARAKTSTHGFTMLEVLISIVVIAFGLLGIAGLQAYAIKNNHSASLRSTATSLANDMIDRMKANYIAVMNGDYNKPNSTDYSTAVASCLTTAGCTSAQLAQNDLNEWAQRVAAALPNGQGIVCVDSTPNDGNTVAAPACDNTGTTMYVVKIWWIDDRSATGSLAAPQRFSWAFNP
ncbi:MAG: pilV 2 [Betaproteobacteria bacterium]|jgi:type IV pilus assembly protein PilV|nr:pilV 2 [Betaproteobacteria bacterium]